MAANKNQHFIPRCYLRPFSLENEGIAINVFNHSSDKAIQNASVKGQCSKPYFYGNDLHLEKAFQPVEGRYAEIIGKIIDNSIDLTDKELSALKNFAFLQMNRTEANVKMRAILYASLDGLAHQGFEEYREEILDISHKKMLISAMGTYARTHHTITDLEVVLIENRTKQNFVTSDDPAILTNRLFLQKLRGRAFSTASSGVQFFMPLTPRHYLVCYDKDAYTVSNKNGYKILIDNVNDVRALNELQFIRCQANIYFQNWDDLDKIRVGFLFSKSYRPESWVQFWVGILTREKNGRKYYRKEKKSEITPSENRIISHNYIHIKPSRWLSGLSYRSKIYGYTNGSAVGYIRKQQVIMFGSKPFWKEEIVFSSKIFDPQEMSCPA